MTTNRRTSHGNDKKETEKIKTQTKTARAAARGVLKIYCYEPCDRVSEEIRRISVAYDVWHELVTRQGEYQSEFAGPKTTMRRRAEER